ncbi:DUF948 domain-containing protein [Alkalinema sp. FACHB-956]|uniref:DUF948 domain-containing protein n=1 Tax=Alkalinema sp. FACHB-956 TaxID=2692768 RepID=UPI001F559861|nr:DUF948 domain-containing protein [Alkalinema sp. FACHB-956]
MDPIFWLGASILLVAVSIAVVLAIAVPAIQELGRAARSAEKLFDTLNRELPPTLEAIRLTGLEISDLTDDMSEGVQNASQVVKQVDEGITGLKEQAQKAQVTTISLFAGVKAAWQTLTETEGLDADRTAAQSTKSERSLPSPSASPPASQPPSSKASSRRPLRSPNPPALTEGDRSDMESDLEEDYF